MQYDAIHNDPLPPWRIEHLRVQNFRCFDELELDLDPRLTVLVGRNGAGKSAALSALGVLLTPLVQPFGAAPSHFRSSDARSIPIDALSHEQVGSIATVYPVWAAAAGAIDNERFTWARALLSERGRTTTGDTKDVRKRVGAFADRAKDPNDRVLLPVVAFYGTNRLFQVRKNTVKIKRSRLGAYEECLNPSSDLRRLGDWFSALYKEVGTAEFLGDEPSVAARRQIESIRAACDSILKVTGWQRLSYVGSLDEIVLRHDVHGVLPLWKLSDGLRISAGLAFDIAARAARANPHLGGPELLENVPGIVLIDEIDLHLHPAWQQQIMPTLLATFPQMQFVVTTHSPQVLSSVKADSVRVLAIDEDGQTRPHGVEHSRGLRADPLLRDVFGVEPFAPSADRELLEGYVSLVERGRGHSQEALEKRRQLDLVFGGAENEPELAAVDASLALDEVLGDR